jgi:hypothetical protein
MPRDVLVLDERRIGLRFATMSVTDRSYWALIEISFDVKNEERRIQIGAGAGAVVIGEIGGESE